MSEKPMPRKGSDKAAAPRRDKFLEPQDKDIKVGLLVPSTLHGRRRYNASPASYAEIPWRSCLSIAG